MAFTGPSPAHRTRLPYALASIGEPRVLEPGGLIHGWSARCRHTRRPGARRAAPLPAPRRLPAGRPGAHLCGRDRPARALGTLFRQRGLQPGQGVGVLSPNRPEVYLGQTAPILAGGRFTALHPLGLPRRPPVRLQRGRAALPARRSAVRRAGRPAAREVGRPRGRLHLRSVRRGRGHPPARRGRGSGGARPRPAWPRRRGVAPLHRRHDRRAQGGHAARPGRGPDGHERR